MTIKEARKNAGLTQAQFSKTFSIPLRTIEDWERGVSKPPAWSEKLIIEKLVYINKVETYSDPLRMYIKVCQKFSKETSGWSQLDPLKNYVKNGTDWIETYTANGVSLNWAFHQSDLDIINSAGNYLFDYLADDLYEALYENEDEAYLRESIEQIYAKYTDT